MKKLILVLLSVSFAFQAATAQQKTPQDIPKLPVVHEIESPAASVADFVKAIGVTTDIEQHDAKGLGPDKEFSYTSTLNPKSAVRVYPNIDLVKFEIQMAENFLAGKGPFKDLKGPIGGRGLIVLRYGVEDERAEKFLVEAKKMGVHSLVLVTDGPITVKPPESFFPEKKDKDGNVVTDKSGNVVREDFSNNIRKEFFTDKEHESWVKTGNGKYVQGLLQEGYKLYSPVQPKKGSLIQAGDFFVVMSALANPKLERTPIMHMKEIVMYELKDPSKELSFENLKNLIVMDGTGNWTRVHVNRTALKVDSMPDKPGLNVFSLKHALDSIENFAAEGRTARIKDITTNMRVRVNAKDGSFVESAYTDGQNELNQRMADELNVLAGDEETLKRLATDDKGELDEKKYQELKARSEDVFVKDVVLSHFVFTNTKVLYALLNLWEAQNAKKRPFQINGVLDLKFVGLRSFGLGALLAGFDTKTSFGQTRRALPKEFVKSVKLYSYLEESKLAKEVDPDGPPTDRVLWHDKTTLITYKTKGQSEFWTSVYTGSYNNSNNYHNLERQDWFYVKNNADMVAAYENSIRTAIAKAVVSTRNGKKKILPIEDAIFVKELGLLIGVAWNDLDWNGIFKLRKKLESLHNLETAEDRLKVISELGKVLRQEAIEKGGVHSRLIKKLHVNREKLDIKLQTIQKFLVWYTSQPFYRQGFDAAIRSNEILALALSFQEDAWTAKQALRKIFWRPYLPDHSLDARSYKVFKYMGLERALKILSPDKPSAFPFAKDVVLTADLLSETLEKEILKDVDAGDLKLAARDLSNWTKKLSAEKSALVLGDQKIILQRLNGMMAVISWYSKLETAPDYRWEVPDLSKKEMVSQLLTENLDLLLLKEQNLENIKETLQWIVSLKGYRNPNGQDKGPLTDLIDKAYEAYKAGEKAEPSTSTQKPKPTKAIVEAPICRAI